MKKDEYWLGHSADEQARLDAQSETLTDPFLKPLIQRSERCLEIGCGVGSNLPWIRSINSNLQYTGIDIFDEAVQSAHARYSSDKNATFQIMDGAKLDFQEKSFDLIFTKFALWAAGSKSAAILKAGFKVLSKGGIFHAYEPDDSLLLFYPPKENLNKALKKWQMASKKKVMNPLIGQELPGSFLKAGFHNIECAVHTHTALGSNPSAYQKAVKNIHKIYFGRGPKEIGMKSTDPLWKIASKEILSVKPGNVVVETHFAVTGRK
jgi:ubiquinone/menaquinone biosynthesis C-methylase UbiE